MVRRARLDAELVRRGLARSREHAGDLVGEGRVRVAGAVATKVATGVDKDTPLLVVDGHDENWASRGAHKLLGALAAFTELTVTGRRCLDAGASTGGFTDVLVRGGAERVIAADVGYGQLVWRLRNDERVTVVDRTNVRNLTPEIIGGPVDLIVADLSFISLRLVLPALIACLRPDGDLVPMVKPQFEVGRERLGAGGVVRSPELRAEVVTEVVAAAGEQGMTLRGVTASPLPGPAGNVEYFLWLTRGSPLAGSDVRQAVDAAVAEGPAT